MDKSSLLLILTWTTLSLSANGATIIKTSHLTSNIDMDMNVVDDNGFDTNPNDMDAIDVYKTINNNNGDELSNVESVSYICDLQHISIVSGHTSITLPLNTFINKLSSLTLSKTESVNSNEINQNPISPSDPINMAPCKIHGTNTLRRYTFYIAIMVIIFGLSIKNTKINLIMNPNFKTVVINMCLLCSLDCVLGRTAVFRFPTEDPTKLSLNPTIDPTTNPTSLNSNTPTIPTFEMLECPQNSTQIGDINTDIRGCGLESCDNRYNITSIQECYNKCNSYSNCLSFSWSPYGGDRSHLNYKVCTLYDTTTAKGTWGPNQILCAMAPTPTTNPSSDPTKDPTIHPTMDPADDPRKYSRGPNTVDSWADAESYCQSLNTTLASIPTQDDWIEANKTCGDNFCWIGLKDDVSEGEWYWTDGTDITTSYGFNADGTATKGQEPWTNREPNNSGNEDCGQLYENGLYNDRWCTSSGLYPLCGIDPTPTPIPTNKPTSAPTTDPTNDPTLYPTDPTSDPTADPTSGPTSYPTNEPTLEPTTTTTTNDPTMEPTDDPTTNPTDMPSDNPTSDPTTSLSPTASPTITEPTSSPTNDPTELPTMDPSTTLQPTSIVPSTRSTRSPTGKTTKTPSVSPTPPLPTTATTSTTTTAAQLDSPTEDDSITSTTITAIFSSLSLCIIAFTFYVYFKTRKKAKRDIEYREMYAKKHFNQDLEMIAQNGINAKYGQSMKEVKHKRHSNGMSPLPVIHDNDEINESDELPENLPFHNTQKSSFEINVSEKAAEEDFVMNDIIHEMNIEDSTRSFRD